MKEGEHILFYGRRGCFFTYTLLSIFLIENPFLIECLKIIRVQIPIKSYKLYPYTHNFLTFDILLNIKSEPKII